MSRFNLNDISAFLVIARERSFTRAAAKLGVSPSALSHAMKLMEEKLGVRLLTRTTRSVTPTEAGERLLESFGPMIEKMEKELALISELREKPAGNIRITCDEYAIYMFMLPKLSMFLKTYPDITIEISIDYGLRDIVSERYDAGVRLGGTLAKDMIAVPLTPEVRSVVVATPEYLAQQGVPQTPHDLTLHRCINLRLPTYGGLYAWEFEKEGRKFSVRVEGQLVFNSIIPMLETVKSSLGVAYLPEQMVQDDIRTGELVEVLSDWTPPYDGYYLYYPSRLHSSPAFTLFLDAIRYRE
ncbi:LysR family transcriptional regulator [Pectobacterium versatile]|uniref:LysR family transcriptional regulator n=2 Tax=Pectobacterium versatile TaxID=2488639 RepID=UPI001CF42FA2|nr:LysR family transcriptional regulator [Pectobacterium versatile]MCA6924734.1 LysR family transcriptional regulator [Pectobacterium versatile]MCH5081499.1 LysR family transcriptional regulator [Pectobacterium versatile]